MNSKQTLLKALKEAERPSRELDAMAEAVLRSKPNANSDHYIFRKFPKWGWRGDGRVEAGDIWWQAQRYTASLDACLALLERVLPEWRLELHEHRHPALRKRGPWYCFIRHPDQAAMYIRKGQCRNASTPALALLIAIVKTHITQEQDQ